MKIEAFDELYLFQYQATPITTVGGPSYTCISIMKPQIFRLSIEFLTVIQVTYIVLTLKMLMLLNCFNTNEPNSAL